MAGEKPDILKKIVSRKIEEVALAKGRRSLEELRGSIADLEDIPRGFERHLREASQSGWTPVIAEIKKASPSRGVIREDFDPQEIAETYQDNGATCISVLTDESFFMGSLHYLGIIRETVSLPLLRKEFICDPYQIYEARAAGADAVLLIAAMLDSAMIDDFMSIARGIHLDVLLEVHDEAEMEMAVKAEASMIGVNNRNLRTFGIDMETTGRLAAMAPDGCLIVAESGIGSRMDIERLIQDGAGAFLVGETLMREADIGSKLRELLEPL